MRVTEIAKLFGGSLVIYFVVAACSAAYTEQAAPTPAPTAGPAPATPSPLDPVPLAMADGTKSGTRLKLQLWEGSDGSRQFVQFFDSQLQTPCAVSASSQTIDGKIRCLPQVAGRLYFSDAMCKTPGVYVVDKTLTPQPKVVAVQPGYSGSLTYQDHYTLKGLINAPAIAYLGGMKDGCQPVPLPADSNYYEVGPPLPPTTFVEMTLKTE